MKAKPSTQVHKQKWKSKHLPCHNKTQFANARNAHKSINNLADRSTRGVVPGRTYLCEYCNCWHLTSKEKI